MKEINAIVKPFKVDKILNKLLEAGYPNITVSLAEGTGTFTDDGAETATCFALTNVEVAKIEIVCRDTDVDNIIEIISTEGHTGNPGDGIIYLTHVERAFRVKSGAEMNF